MICCVCCAILTDISARRLRRPGLIPVRVTGVAIFPADFRRSGQGDLDAVLNPLDIRRETSARIVCAGLVRFGQRRIDNEQDAYDCHGERAMRRGAGELIDNPMAEAVKRLMGPSGLRCELLRRMWTDLMLPPMRALTMRSIPTFSVSCGVMARPAGSKEEGSEVQGFLWCMTHRRDRSCHGGADPGIRADPDDRPSGPDRFQLHDPSFRRSPSPPQQPRPLGRVA